MEESKLERCNSTCSQALCLLHMHERTQPCSTSQISSQTHTHTHTCRYFIIDFHAFNNSLTYLAFVSQECRKREIIGLSHIPPGGFGLQNHSNISGISPHHHWSAVIILWGENNVLNCRSEGAMVFLRIFLCTSSSKLTRVTKGYRGH